jgi:1-acyl-sn-glycerol-3-phosphate acyltransferase
LGALRASPENAERLLGEQRPVVVFPEGIQGIGKPFSQRYRLQRFGRGGFIKLALRLKVPVIPVALVGSEETHPLLAKLPFKMATLPYLPVPAAGLLPLPVKWSVTFGEPIDLEALPPSAADDLGVVQRLTERTREAIQQMLDEAVKQRKSVFAG